jgi:transcriptional regulator with XRE-family HTH domain
MDGLGERLRLARESKGLGQKDVEALTGINYKTISNYENNRSEPDAERLAILCEVYGVSADFLIGSNGNTSASSTTAAEIDQETLQIYNELHELLLKAGYIKPGELLTPKQGKALIALIHIIDLAFDDSE